MNLANVLPRDERYDKVCHDSIDNFALSDSLLKAQGVEKNMLTAKGADYGADAYGVDRARPSDHCAVTLALPL